MNLIPIGLPELPGQLGRQGVREEELAGLFDQIVAAAATQLVPQDTPAAPFAGTSDDSTRIHAATPLSLMSANVATAEPPPALEPAPTVRNGQLFEADAGARAPSPPARLRDTNDEPTNAVRHGTLPVIVSGQLIELALLRERKPTRESTPTRRLSMVLDAPSGPVAVRAHVIDGALVVELDGEASAELSIRDACTREVETLARRLGWSFEELKIGTALK